MSYQTRYFAEFIDAPIRNVQMPYVPRMVLVRFMLNNYDGPQEEIKLNADSGLRRLREGSKTLFETIRATTIEISLRINSPAVAKGLFAEYDQQWRVEIYRKIAGGADDYKLDFAGWLRPSYTEFGYQKPPFSLSLTANCGLASLKDRLLLDSNGKRLSVSESLSTVIRTALNLTGHDLEMISAMNLYELSDMAAGQTVPGPGGIQTADSARDPLRRTLLNTLSLINEKNETITAYDALKNVLEAFPGGLRISQEGGKWMIVRGAEANGGWDPQNIANDTVRARIYPAGTAANSAPATNQSIKLSTIIYPGNAVRAKTGGATGMTPQKAGVQIEQKFGSRISKFPNGDLSQADNTGLPNGWDRVVFAPREAQRVGSGTELDPYWIKILGAGDNLNALQKQAIGVRIQFPTGITTISSEFNRAKKWTLKGRYKLFKARAMQATIYAVKSDGIYLASQSGEWKKAPARKDNVTLRFDNSFGGGTIYNPTTTDFSITLNPIDKVTNLFIRFHDPEDLDRTDGQPGGQKNPDAYVLIGNLSLTVDTDGLNLTGQSVSTSRDGRKPETVATLVYGDYPLGADDALSLTGILTTRSTGSPTATWHHPADATRTAGKPLIQHHLQIRANQAMQAVDSWQGKLTGPLPYGMHTVLLFADIGDVDPNFGFIVPWPFVITALETDERLLEHTVTAVRYMPDITLPGKKAYWQTPDGEILQSSDETSGATSAPVEPVTPSLPNLPPNFFDQIYAGLNLPVFQNLPGLVPSGQAGNVTLTLDSGTGAPPASGVSYYRAIPDNLYDILDNGPA